MAIALSIILEGSKDDSLTKSVKDPKLHRNLRQISLLSTTGKLFEKVILRIIRMHVEGNNLLDPYQFGFRARNNTTLQCMRLAHHLTLNFKNDLDVVFSGY
jgi:hypothetical protein